MEDADNEVKAVNPPFLHHIGVIITFDACERKMPDCPIGGKEHRGVEQVHTGTQAVGAIAVPSKFFEYGGEYEEKPNGEYAGGKRVMPGDDELRGAVAKQKRDSHCTQDTGRQQQTRCNVIPPLVLREIKETTEEICSQVRRAVD